MVIMIFATRFEDGVWKDWEHICNVEETEAASIRPMLRLLSTGESETETLLTKGKDAAQSHSHFDSRTNLWIPNGWWASGQNLSVNDSDIDDSLYPRWQHYRVLCDYGWGTRGWVSATDGTMNEKTYP